jgi:hypothetical protein
VTIKGNSKTFEGFFVQARKLGDDTNSHGTFGVVNSDSEVQTLTCFGKANVSRLTASVLRLSLVLIFRSS